jgi:MFS family permease
MRDVFRIIALIAANMMLAFPVGAVIGAIPAMAQYFGGGIQGAFFAQLILVVPMVALIFGAPAAGFLAEIYHRKPTLMVGLVAYAIFGSAGMFVDNIWILLISRAAMGLAVGLISTVATTLAGDYYEGERRDTVVGWLGMAPTAGSVIGIFLSGVLVDVGGWHLPFVMYLLAAPALALAIFSLDEPAVASSKHQDKEALPLRLFVICTLGGVAAISVVLPVFQIPLMLASEGVTRASVSSSIITVVAVVGSIVAPFYARLRHALSTGGVLGLMFVSVGASDALVAASGTIPGVIAASVLAGIGGGLLIPHFMVITMDVASEKARSRAIGFAISAIFLGEFLIPFVAEPLHWAFGLRGMFAAMGAFGLVAGPVLGFAEFRTARRSMAVG